MDVQPSSLEELIENATDINNYASNDVQAQAVANQVNRVISGSGTAIKVLIQKLQMRQEVVTLQALNIVEVCVKNCGVNFHNEVGKYKFINELIKLLSAKYDGDITPQSVKERVIGLMFSWYVGLPQQTKISEAYKMLKQQGIIKRDPVDPNRTGDQPMPRENENTAFQDEGNTQLLKTLLSSKDAEDLHSANKLIKNMVKQEEERLDRVSKRIQVLETVANNVKLLDDMIAKYEPGSSVSSLEIMNELYERCLTLRPELFRLASKNAEEKDDSVSDILLASDELTRVIDSYKERVLFKGSSDAKTSPVSQSQTAESSTADSAVCLLDLGMDSPKEQNGLPDDFKLLGLSTHVADTNPPVGAVSAFPVMQTNWNTVNSAFPVSQVNPIQPVSQFNPIPTMFTAPSSSSSVLPNSNTTIQPVSQFNPIPTMFTAPPSSSSVLPNSNTTIPILKPAYNPQPQSTKYSPQNSNIAPVGIPKTSNNPTPKKDLLDFDIFESDFLKNTKPESTKVIDNFTLDGPPLFTSIKTDSAMASPATLPAYPIKPMSAPATVLPAQSGHHPTTVPTQMPGTIPPSQVPTEIPIQVQNVLASQQTPVNYLVPLEALKSGKYDPIPVLDKDGLKTFLLITEDTREDANPNVIVSILSTLSLNTNPLSDFNIQVAVPKIMRVKLQPATTNHLGPFNPLGAPPSISQIMLIANPTKETVKLRFKMNYTLGGVPHVETANIDNLPVR